MNGSVKPFDPSRMRARRICGSQKMDGTMNNIIGAAIFSSRYIGIAFGSVMAAMRIKKLRNRRTRAAAARSL